MVVTSAFPDDAEECRHLDKDLHDKWVLSAVDNAPTSCHLLDKQNGEASAAGILMERDDYYEKASAQSTTCLTVIGYPTSTVLVVDQANGVREQCYRLEAAITSPPLQWLITK